MAQMKEQNKTLKNELSKMEIANLSNAEFKTLVIRMLKELTEYSNQIKKTQEDMKVILSEIKKNLQGTNSGRDETRIKINYLEHKEEISIQPEQQEGRRIQKNEDRINCLWDISKCTNIQIIGMPEEEEEQETENLFETIMKEKFPNLAKEIDIQVQEAQRIPNKLDPKRTTTRHIIIKSPKIKDKERILKATREKELLQRSVCKTVS